MRGIYRPASICDNNQATKAKSSLEVLGQYQTGLRGRKQLSPAGKVGRVSGSICAVTHELGLVRGCCYTRGFNMEKWGAGIVAVMAARFCRFSPERRPSTDRFSLSPRTDNPIRELKK